MRITEQGIEDTVQWTIITLAVVACGAVVFTVGNVINKSLLATGVL